MAVNLVNRVLKLVTSAKAEWDVIDKEPADITGILTTYVGPLVAVDAIVFALGLIVFGISAVFFTYHPPIVGTIIYAITFTVLNTVMMVYVFAFIVDALAPNFGAQKNFNQAFKIAAFAGTGLWLGLILGIFPGLWMIGGIVGLAFSAYLLLLGVPKLMKPPADQTMAYAAVAIAIHVVLFFVTWFIVSRVLGSLLAPSLTGPGIGGIQISP